MSLTLLFAAAATVFGGELLHNGIVLPDVWPPQRSPTQAFELPGYISNPPATIPIDLGRQLFVDDFLIESTTLQRSAHRPQMYNANPVLTPGGPDSASFAMPYSDGAWFDPADNLYKMWYLGGTASGVSYAYSADGKTWIKPSIPDSPIPNTNIVIALGARDSATVWMDLSDSDPSRKFKAFTFRFPNLLGVYFSPDGIRWTAQSNTLNSLSDRTTVFWNPFRGVWVDSMRGDTTIPAAGSNPARNSRVRYYAESPDLTNWSPASPTASFWTGPDENDPPYVAGGALPELYNLDAIAYESLMVGLFSWYHPGPSYNPNYGAGPNLVELGVGFSRDGYSWVRPTRGSNENAFIPATNVDGTWNAYNTQSVGGGFLVVGDELWFYFSGRTMRKPDSGVGSAGLATLRRDGFYSMDAGAQQGVMTTRPVKFNGNHMYVNVDAAGGQLFVEVLNQQGAVIAPFSKANCVPVSVNSTLHEIRWSGATDLSALRGTPVKFRFYLTNGKLYSFWVTPNSNGASNGYVAAGGPGFPGPVDTVGRVQTGSMVATPLISPLGGSYNTAVSVSMSVGTPSAEIRYTMDGSEPTVSSALYSQPFALTMSAVVKARAFRTGMTASLVSSARFTVPDVTPPTVTITSPSNGQTITGTVSLVSAASDDTGVVGVKFGVDGALVGSEVMTPPYSLALDTRLLSNGNHQVIAVARDAAGFQTTSSPITITVQNSANNAAVFLSTDTTTLGNWKGVYGQDGNYIVQHSTLVPSYSNFEPRGVNVQVRNPYSTDPRALQRFFYTFTSTERIESHFHAVESMDFDVSATDNQWHRIALYFCDWDSAGRGITVEARDGATNTLLDSRPLTSYQNGVYLVYRYRGRISFRVRNNNPVATAPTASVSAFLWGGPVTGGDSVAPSVAITSPVAGSTVSGTVGITASALDDIGVIGVQYKLDGANLEAELTAAPYNRSWNTTGVTNGIHQLVAVARDAAGNYATSAAISVNVSNVPPDSQSPSVAISSPATGSLLSQTVTLTALATDNVGVVGVQFKLNGAPLGAEKTSSPFTEAWDTKTVSNASYSLTAVARDAAGNTATSPVTLVTVNNAVPDTEVPTVSIGSPGAGASISGTVTISANASDNIGIVGVQFKLDGANLGVEKTSAPYSVLWDTLPVANGTHALMAVARDAAGNTTNSTPITISVNNVVLDIVSPSVSITTPTAGATVSGTVALNANSTDNIGVLGVQFKLDGANLGAEKTAAPYSVSWDTTVATNGAHSLTAVARDAAGNSTTSNPILVTVNNIVADTSAPAVSITSPGAGATVSLTISVTANASDNISVAGVQFMLDGANLGAEKTSAPYSVSWDTKSATNGTHSIVAVARDAAGNSTTSSAIQVNVQNVIPDTQNPAVSITSPGGGATVNATITIVASASDNVGVVGVQFKLDGSNFGAERTSAPYSTSWDTTTVSNGNHTLSAVARDAAGNVATATAIQVTVNNVAPDGTPPTISIFSPTSGESLSGVASLSAYATDNIGVVGVQFKLDGVNLGPEKTSIPFSIAWTTTENSNGPHVLTAIARDAAGNVAVSSPVTLLVANIPATGTYVLPLGQDNSTKGDWKTVYGQDGNYIVQHSTLVPAYSDFSPTGANSAVLDTFSTDPRAPLKYNFSFRPTERITSHFYSRFSFDFTVSTSDNQSHRIALYFCDWERLGRTVSVSVLDANTSAVLDTQLLSNYAEGVYLVYNYRGRITFRVANSNSSTVGNPNGTLSSIFWGGSGVPVQSATNPGDATPPTISIVSPISQAIVSGVTVLNASATDNVGVTRVQYKLDGVNLGSELTSAPYSLSWDTALTANGAHILTAVAHDAAGNTGTSASTTVTVSNVALDTTPPLVSFSSPTAGAGVSGTVTVGVAASDNVGVAGVQFKLNGNHLGAERTTAPFSVAWDTSAFSNGPYTLSAVARDAAGNTSNAQVAVTVNNAVAPSGNTVDFIGVDTITKGNWKGVYGQDGNYIAQHSTLVPSYARLLPTAVNLYVRNPYSSDVRALQKQFFAFTIAERIESYMHIVGSMTFDVSASDTQTHRVALYFCDFERLGRSITVEALDAVSGALLHSRVLTDYKEGVYLVYSYRGKILFRIRNNNPVSTAPTASISGFFWGGTGLP